jgi:Na+-translocating ferredoxin:NAD+ oxidoreductase RnfD subunit
MTPNDQWYAANRLGGLRRFAVAITVLNLLGHTVLGFEQSWAQPLVALATAYSMELLLEWLEAWSQQRPWRFAGGMRPLVDFLLSAHISGLAVAMLLYANEQLWPIAFAAAVAIGSKIVLRAPVGHSTRHIFNPSNFGITITLLVFPWVGIAPPYHFTENLYGVVDWLLPGLIVVTGSFVNARFTKRLPLIAAWLTGFVAQAVLRSWVCGTPVGAALLPMTGMAFILYTFYMVTDPATTPSAPRAQVVFGAAVAAVYGLLLVLHVVFGLFFALTIVCVLRGLMLYAYALVQPATPTRVAAPEPVMVGRPAL